MGKNKKKLKKAFKSQLLASDFQIELNSVKLKYNEDVNSYSNRVEELYFKLCNAKLLNKSETEKKIMCDTIREQTLAVYIKKLIHSIRTIVKSRNPKTFKQAKQIARSEEIEFNSAK